MKKRPNEPIFIAYFLMDALSIERFTRIEVERYKQQLPAQLWDILLPSESENPFAFALAVKRLRIREHERNYVLAIQRRFDIPVRPNESVKESMTRARLKILLEPGNSIRRGRKGHMPTDPLE